MDVHLSQSSQDHVTPFVVEALNVRGRIVRLDATLTTLLSQHQYGLGLSKVVSEGVVLSCLLGSALKGEGRFLLQTRSDGELPTFLADYRAPHFGGDHQAGHIRAYARLAEGVDPHAFSYTFGKGSLAFTIDMGEHTERYQGIVDLQESLTASALHYFQQSEQIPSFLKICVAEESHRDAEGLHSGLRAAGILLQHLPDEDAGEENLELWQEALTRMTTLEENELLDFSVSSDTLVHRLYHDYGYKVFTGFDLEAVCTCSEERIKQVLDTFTEGEKQDMTTDAGVIEVTCEFCSKRYTF